MARNRHTPAVVLTRSLETNCYLQAMQLGAVDYLENNLAPKGIDHLVATRSEPPRTELAACNA